MTICAFCIFYLDTTLSGMITCAFGITLFDFGLTCCTCVTKTLTIVAPYWVTLEFPNPKLDIVDRYKICLRVDLEVGYPPNLL